MGQKDKLIKRLKTHPKDFTFDEAETLLKLASDMAALTPGKTVMDAMEALADLKLGERERIEFCPAA